MLTKAEQKMNFLLHETITPTNYHLNMTNNFILYDDNLQFCAICFYKKRTILFSCSHVSSCFSCCLKLLQSQEQPRCPICRRGFTWLRNMIFLENNYRCRNCETNLIDIYQDPCSHILLCNQCLSVDSNEDFFCRECNREIKILTQVKFA